MLSVPAPHTFHIVHSDAEHHATRLEAVTHSPIRINGGFFTFKQEIFDHINEGEELVIEPFQRLIKQQQLIAQRHDGFWACMDTFKERQLLEAWSGTDAPYPADTCIHQLFAAQAAKTPDAVALVSGDEAVTYGELNRRANRLAHHLAGRGVGPDARVAICVERGPAMVVGVAMPAMVAIC